jgi:hypothetical protein
MTWHSLISKDFSCDLFQDSNELDEALKESSDVPFKIEWPIRKNSALEEDDSGVCESVSNIKLMPTAPFSKTISAFITERISALDWRIELCKKLPKITT